MVVYHYFGYFLLLQVSSNPLAGPVSWQSWETGLESQGNHNVEADNENCLKYNELGLTLSQLAYVVVI